MFASLRVVTPPATEPVEIASIRRHCRVDSNYDDDLLTAYAISARTLAEQYLNRALITQELLFSMMHSPPPMASPMVPQALVVWPINWPGFVARPMTIPRAPCREIVSVLWGNIDDLQPADPGDYVANLTTEPATITLSSILMPLFPSQSMQIAYRAGYGDDAADVPPPIKHAIMMLTAWMFENRGDVAGDVPQGIWNMLTPYRLWQFAG